MRSLSLKPFNESNLIIKRKCSSIRKQLIQFNKWTIKLKISITHLLVLHSVYHAESVIVLCTDRCSFRILVKIMCYSYHLIAHHDFYYSQAVIEHIF